MKHWRLILALFLGLHLLLLLSTQFTAWPEMLFWPYLVLKGWLPYKDIGIVHSPLLVLELSFFYKVFGLRILQQKIFTWLLIVVLDLLLFKLSKKLFDTQKALLTLFFFIVLQVYYDGNGVWFDHALAIFPISIFYLLEKKRFFLTGLCWAIAFLTKQTAFWFLIPIFYSLCLSRHKKQFSSSFAQAVLLIGCILFVGLAIFGLQKDYLHWAIAFGIGTLPKFSGRLPETKVLLMSFLPYLFFIPLIVAKKKKYFTILLWAMVGMMGTFPRFELFHFQPALPFIALSFSLLVVSIKKYHRTLYPLASLTIMLLVFVMLARGIARKLNQPDRFNDTNDQKIAQVVDELTSPNQLIFVTNYWDNLYPITKTLPAIKPFIPQLPQYIYQPGVEEGILKNLEITRPRLVVRGEFDSASSVYRFPLINDYIDKNYKILTTINGVDIMQLIADL